MEIIASLATGVGLAAVAVIEEADYNEFGGEIQEADELSHHSRR
jgi:hypothetical protein